ncbi:hypothetical protein [Microvirga terricola]|uniref:Uncharacterized protein n=1 Tax=Microvirga terricola TaxID=2719797 RepID=A0ABX0V8A2_9HYPH|nr:hypothetical protein [Microvirga terricola]NIX75446.1 hypothetical protein [Microvirga terricola]
MRRFAVLALGTLAATTALSIAAEAQTRRERPLVLRVTPRSYLDPGTMVLPDSINPGISGYGQTQSLLLMPPYTQQRETLGGLGVLPDPITNGPFVGARNPFAP